MRSAIAKEVSLKRLLPLSLVFTILSIVLNCPSAQCTEWELLTEENSEIGVFYNKEKITYPTPASVRVWVWYTDSMNLYEIHCSSKYLQVKHVIKYDSKGNVLLIK